MSSTAPLLYRCFRGGDLLEVEVEARFNMDERPASDSSGTVLGTHDFEADISKHVAAETNQLFQNRLQWACWIGAVLFPAYGFVDLLVSWQQPNLNPCLPRLILRLLFGALLVGGGQMLRRRPMAGWQLQLIDIGLFFGGGSVISFIVAQTWTTLPDYWVALTQMMVARGIFFPGGPRRALPTCLGIIALFWISLGLFSGLGLGAFTGQSGQRAVVVTFGLIGFMVMVLAGSLMYDRTIKREVASRYLGRYRIEEPVGMGAWGMIYRAWDNHLNRPCAIKVISSKRIGGSREIRSRFEREARRTSMLQSSHIVSIYDYGETVRGDLYYSMELLEGIDLRQLVQESGAQPAERVVRIASQIAAGLAEAHRQGLVHRDVKPANIIILQHEEQPDFVKIVDFGMVKELFTRDPITSSTALTAAQTVAPEATGRGALTGTPAFMAPEQILGAAADPRVDIYALGGIMYHLLTGDYPFKDVVLPELLAAKLYRDPRPLRAVAHSRACSTALEEIIMRCLARDPEQRFQSMTDLRSALVRLDHLAPRRHDD